MGRIFKEAMAKTCTAKVSKEIVSGLAGTELAPDKVMRYMEDRLRGEFNGVSTEVRFVSIERCGVNETINKTILRGSNTSRYDINESYVYMTKLQFTFKGTPLPLLYLAIPYVDDGCILKMSGSSYGILPVTSDKSISPGDGDVFIRLHKDKIRIREMEYTMYKDEELLRGRVYLSQVYKQKPRNGAVTKAKATILMYLLVNYGFKEAMSKLLGVNVMLCSQEDSPGIDREKYVVYQTSGTLKAARNIVKAFPKMVAVVRKEDDNKTVSTAMLNLFYILDHKPELTIKEMENLEVLRLTLAEILFGRMDVSRQLELCTNHIELISQYVDSCMVTKLHEDFGATLGEDFSEDGFNKVLMVILRRYDSWRQAASEISASCYDKRFEILYYLFYNIFKKFNTFNFNLSKKQANHLTVKSVGDDMIKEVTPRIIYSIRNDNTCCTLVHYSGNHKAFRYTCIVQLQLNVRGVAGANSKQVTASFDPSTLIHHTQAVGGSVNSLNKSRLAPARYFNIFAPFSPKTMTVLPTKEIVEETSRLRDIIRSTPNRGSEVEIPKEFDRYLEE